MFGVVKRNCLLFFIIAKRLCFKAVWQMLAHAFFFVTPTNNQLLLKIEFLKPFPHEVFQQCACALVGCCHHCHIIVIVINKYHPHPHFKPGDTWKWKPKDRHAARQTHMHRLYHHSLDRCYQLKTISFQFSNFWKKKIAFSPLQAFFAKWIILLSRQHRQTATFCNDNLFYICCWLKVQ